MTTPTALRLGESQRIRYKCDSLGNRMTAKSNQSDVAFCTAKDGVVDALHLDEAKPASDTVLCLPAMGVDAAYYEPLAACLAEQGFAVARGELRGHGESPVSVRRGSDFGYKELVEYSVPAMVAELQKRLSPKRIFLLGHSLGGHMAMLYASIHPTEVQGFAMVASGTTYYRAWQGAQQLRIFFGTQTAAIVASALGYFPGHKLGFAGREPRQQMLDWARCARTGTWQITHSQHDYEDLLKRIQLPVLGVSLDGDTFAPRSALEFHLAKMPKAQINHVHLDASSSPETALHHFRWARQPEAVVHCVRQWADSLP